MAVFTGTLNNGMIYGTNQDATINTISGQNLVSASGGNDLTDGDDLVDADDFDVLDLRGFHGKNTRPPISSIT